MINKEEKITKIQKIIQSLEEAIVKKQPFSLIRFGDGGIKMMHSVIFNDERQIQVIVRREGIPRNKIIEVINSWGFFSRKANYIDCQQIYFTDKFWPRCKKDFRPITEKTNERMQMWRFLNDFFEFGNGPYCNPEINYLLCLRLGKKKNLIDIMKNRKIGFITAIPEVTQNLKEFDVDVIEIVKHEEDHYENSYYDTIREIEKNANRYDFWLVAAGELGRIYTGLIKFYGGRAIDIGFIAEYWSTGALHQRLETFMEQNKKNPLEFILTDEGEKYQQYI